jgi:hypothetical protein
MEVYMMRGTRQRFEARAWAEDGRCGKNANACAGPWPSHRLAMGRGPGPMSEPIHCPAWRTVDTDMLLFSGLANACLMAHRLRQPALAGQPSSYFLFGFF